MRSHMTWEDFSTATPAARQNTSRVFQLPAYLPDPCFIVGVDFLAETSALTGLNCKPILLNDPKGAYKNNGGWPPSPPGQDTDVPYNAPLAMRQLHRLAVLDLQPGARRQIMQPWHYPVRNSRSEGDWLFYDMAGAPQSVWFCVAIYYLDPESYGQDPLPPLPAGNGWGPWGYPSATTGSNPTTYGRTWINDASGRSKFAIKFTAPWNGDITLCRFRIINLNAKDSVIFQLYSNNNGSPGAPIGAPSWPWLIGKQGVQEPQWPLDAAAEVTQGTTYWLVGSMVNGTLNADIDVCPAVTGYSAGRGDVITNITNNLPNGDCIRMLIDAIEPPV